jgi:hypothetical protein
MNIPARYCTGYLATLACRSRTRQWIFQPGSKPISAACGTPLMHDTTSRASGRVLIAHGRDAADVAITTTFGPNTLSSFTVWTEEVAQGE